MAYRHLFNIFNTHRGVPVPSIIGAQDNLAFWVICISQSSNWWRRCQNKRSGRDTPLPRTYPPLAPHGNKRGKPGLAISHRARIDRDIPRHIVDWRGLGKPPRCKLCGCRCPRPWG